MAKNDTRSTATKVLRAILFKLQRAITWYRKHGEKKHKSKRVRQDGFMLRTGCCFSQRKNFPRNTTMTFNTMHSLVCLEVVPLRQTRKLTSIVKRERYAHVRKNLPVPCLSEGEHLNPPVWRGNILIPPGPAQKEIKPLLGPARSECECSLISQIGGSKL